MTNLNTQSEWMTYEDLVMRGLITNRATLRRWIARGWFPMPVELSPHAVRWSRAEILAWEADKLAKRRSYYIDEATNNGKVA